MVQPLPQRICHADWSLDAKKRWLCVAERVRDSYRIAAPAPVGELTTLPERLRNPDDAAAVLLGLDCPIGIPAAYARLVGIEDFGRWLPELGRGRWQSFFDVAREAGEIRPERPFYPYNSQGGRRRAQLLDGLGLADNDDLLRRCERRTGTRGSAAESLFWTLGAKQVGKAAISAWRDFLQPAVAEAPTARLWPFDGDLESLCASPGLIIAETYPAESGLHVGLPPAGRGWSKQKSADRAARGAEIVAWAERRGVTLGAELVAQINDGFGPHKSGEDPFDSLVGVAGMLEVMLGYRPDSPALSAVEKRIEGWIFGQS